MTPLVSLNTSSEQPERVFAALAGFKAGGNGNVMPSSVYSPLFAQPDRFNLKYFFSDSAFLRNKFYILSLLYIMNSKALFENLLAEFRDRILNLCLYMTGSREDAEDCTQETFIKVYNNLNSFGNESCPYAWIRRIAVNTCLDHQKKPFSLFKFLMIADEEDRLVCERPSPENICLSKESGRILYKAVSKLPLKLRTVLVLRELDELSYSEIASMLNISEGTVKSRISRARTELAVILKDFREHF